MSNKNKKTQRQNPDIGKLIVEKLREQGIDPDNLCCDNSEDSPVKVVCVASDLSDSFRELSRNPRGETIMVRIDEESRKTLDAWVQTGHFKSRSEAAALFLKEGLNIRSAELNELKDAIKQVEEAKKLLHDKAQNILGVITKSKS